MQIYGMELDPGRQNISQKDKTDIEKEVGIILDRKTRNILQEDGSKILDKRMTEHWTGGQHNILALYSVQQI
jgi:hypothetical protein